jgi:hypothetical protein
VNDIILMEKVDCINDLPHDILDIDISEIINLLNPVEQLSALTVFEHHVVVLAVLVDLEQSHQVRVVHVLQDYHFQKLLVVRVV